MAGDSLTAFLGYVLSSEDCCCLSCSASQLVYHFKLSLVHEAQRMVLGYRLLTCHLKLDSNYILQSSQDFVASGRGPMLSAR